MIANLILQAETTGTLASLLPFAAMILVLYFFMIRPQQTKNKKEKAFRSTLKRGTKVVTTSGIHGKITDINNADSTVVVETGAGKIKFEQSAISMELSKKFAPVERK